MSRRDDSSPNRGVLRRPRIHSLIRSGLHHPLLVMLAGPGYGKTQAMLSYLAESDVNALWLRLTELDNIIAHFWDHVIATLQLKYPDLAKSLHALEFPSTVASFAAFVRILAKNYSAKKPLIWVFDDFSVLHNEEIKTFFRHFVDMELEKFSLVLISSGLANTESIAFLSSKRFLVLAKDLRFTPEEISQLYLMHGMSLEPDELERIEQHTEGWALALRLLVQQRNKTPNTRLLDEITIHHMFEERFFSTYTKKQQLVLVRLSLLNYFTTDLFLDLYEGNPADLETLENHAFYTQEPNTERRFWHHLYQLFLRKKQYLLDGEDKRRTWRLAAEHYTTSGDIMEAISCYRKAEDHGSMLMAISLFARKLRGITEKDGAFLLTHLDLLSPQERHDYPIADYLRAQIYMDLLAFKQSEALLLDLEKRLTNNNKPDENTNILLGNVYISFGFIHMMRNQENYGDFFKQADAYLPDGSNFHNKDALAIGNNNCFALADNLPGARERMEQAAYRAAPWINKVLRGCMSGMEHIISAESAFMVGDFEKARQQAYKGIYKAESNGQYDYACNGYFVLSRIGLLQGDLAEMTGQVQSLVACTAKHKVAVLEEIRDTILAWFYLKLHDFNRIPKTIRTLDDSNRPLPTYGRLQIVYANYLLVRREYARMVAMLEHPKGLFLSDGIWHDRIYLFIFLAAGHHHLNNSDAAMKALWSAYDMCYHNKLTTLFVETSEYLRPLIRLARRQRQYAFSRQWLDMMYDQINNFSQTMETVRTEYQKQNPAQTAKNNPLSKREKAVMQLLAQGLTREEIALKQYISVNTVKAAIRSIYDKLNASNRAEAVSIAIARKYIEGYPEE